MREKIMRSPNKERAQSLVEFAISIIIILTLLAGAVDFGRALFSLVALRDAVQEGALYGSFNPTLDDGDNLYEGEALDCTAIAARVRSASSNPVDLTDTAKVSIFICTVPPGSSSFTCTNACDDSAADPCEGAGAGIQVRTVYEYTLTMPLIDTIIGSNTIPLSASVTDAMLNPLCPSP